MNRKDPDINQIKKLLSGSLFELPGPITEIIPIQEELDMLVSRAWPGGTQTEKADLVCGLAALWEVSRTHVILVTELLRMDGKPEIERLRPLGQELYINWFSNASGWMKTIKPTLARFKLSLYDDELRQPTKKKKSSGRRSF